MENNISGCTTKGLVNNGPMKAKRFAIKQLARKFYTSYHHFVWNQHENKINFHRYFGTPTGDDNHSSVLAQTLNAK